MREGTQRLTSIGNAQCLGPRLDLHGVCAVYSDYYLAQVAVCSQVLLVREPSGHHGRCLHGGSIESGRCLPHHVREAVTGVECGQTRADAILLYPRLSIHPVD